MRIIKEISLSRCPPKNPIPALSGGGDCGACVMAGVLNISVAEAYELHCSGEYYGGKPIPKVSSWNKHSMKRTLESLVNPLSIRKENNQPPAPLEHVITDVPIWPFDQPHTMTGMAYGLTAGMQYSPWSDYVRGLLAGGYYGIAQVHNNGFKGELRHYGLTDHWVMIKGWRYVYLENTNPETKPISSGYYTQEICIGNSANNSPQEEWIDLGDFLRYWGGFGSMWAKPLEE